MDGLTISGRATDCPSFGILVTVKLTVATGGSGSRGVNGGWHWNDGLSYRQKRYFITQGCAL